jgi:hypothetical protein
MRGAMRRSPQAFAEGLGAWAAGVTDELGLEAANVAADTLAEILLIAANYMTGGKWSG